jgi:3-methyladenine DNA glycosylase AlkC
MIRAVHPQFPQAEFLRDALAGYGPMSLTGRGFHIAAALRKHLPTEYPQAIEVLLASASQPHGHQASGGMAAFLYMPHLFFVAQHGLDHFEASMRAQHALTQRFTAEYSIRAFLEKHPEATLARLREWAGDPSHHVRRLVSEGTRPRLPWAPRLRAFQKDPRPVLELLELLKDDPELYVRRSVANNLNDITKDHADWVFAHVAGWDLADERSAWIVKHALRSRIKQGDARALKLIGASEGALAVVEGLAIEPSRVAIGGEVEIAFELRSTAEATQRLVVDYAVHYVKKNGRASPKVFKLKTVELEAGASTPIRIRRALRNFTTRTHYAGTHAIEVMVNGQKLAGGAFELLIE